MKAIQTTLWITRTEIKSLFYTPIAWLILILFAAQTGYVFSDALSGVVRSQELKYPIGFITADLFVGRMGVFPNVQKYIYLYIPLLTMGLMSREYSTGSIKLLYSSPVKPIQILLGKYFALLVMSLCLLTILGLQALFAYWKVESLDWPLVVNGLLGLFLLIAAYGAIGLWMSSLTQYQMVAAIGTLAVLALLNFVNRFAQDMDFVRDLTYWLSLLGRTENFIRGIFLSKDVLYFVLLVLLFLGWAWIKLQGDRMPMPAWRSSMAYLGTLLICVMIGYLSTIPFWIYYKDFTRGKNNTLTQDSQDIVSRIEGPLRITTYTNLLDMDYNVALPVSMNHDRSRFNQYIYAKPDIELDYVYYIHPTKNLSLERRYPDLNDQQRAEELAKVHKLDLQRFKTAKDVQDIPELKEENYRFIRVVEQTKTGKKIILRLFDDATRHPSEAEISVALKRMVTEMPRVGFFGGRNSKRDGDAHYHRFAREKFFRYSLVNQGFDAIDIDLTSRIPDDISILVIADPQKALLPEELNTIESFIERGGNLLIAGEPQYGAQYLNPVLNPLGVSIGDHSLNQPNDDYKPDLIQSIPSEGLIERSHHFEFMALSPRVITMPGASILDTLSQNSKESNFQRIPLLHASKGSSWLGDSSKHYMTGLALERKVQDKTQKIVILSDADLMSNIEISMRRKGVRSSNFIFVTGIFNWLSDGLAPLDTRREPSIDTSISINQDAMDIWGRIFRYIFPLSLALFAAGLLFYRKRL